MSFKETGYGNNSVRREGPAYGEQEAGIQEGEEDVVPYELQTPQEAKVLYLKEITECRDLAEFRSLRLRVIGNPRTAFGTPEGSEVRTALEHLRTNELASQIAVETSAFIEKVRGVQTLEDFNQIRLEMIADDVVFPFNGEERKSVDPFLEEKRVELKPQIDEFVNRFVQEAREANHLDDIYKIWVKLSGKSAALLPTSSPDWQSARDRVLGQRYRFEVELDQRFNEYQGRMNQAGSEADLDIIQKQIFRDNAFPSNTEEFDKLKNQLYERKRQIEKENSPEYLEYARFMREMRESYTNEELDALREKVRDKYSEKSNEFQAIMNMIDAKAIVIEHPEILT